jgi:proline iminopeptidase
MIEDIEEIRKHYGAEKVYLLAHSFGGIPGHPICFKISGSCEGSHSRQLYLNMKYSLQQQISYMNKLMNTDFKAEDATLLSDFITAKSIG